MAIVFRLSLASMPGRVLRCGGNQGQPPLMPPFQSVQSELVDVQSQQLRQVVRSDGIVLSAQQRVADGRQRFDGIDRLVGLHQRVMMTGEQQFAWLHVDILSMERNGAYRSQRLEGAVHTIQKAREQQPGLDIWE